MTLQVDNSTSGAGQNLSDVVQPFVPSQLVSDVKDRQSAYNDAVRDNQVGGLQDKVGKSIHHWEHLTYVLQGAKSAPQGADQYYRVVDALNLCKEKFGDFHNAIAENFKARVEQSLTGEKFLTINISEQFPILSDMIEQSLTEALREVVRPIESEVTREMEACIEGFESQNLYEDLPLLMANVKAVLLKKIEDESNLAKLIDLRKHPMMTEELSSEIFKRMDAQINKLIDIEVAAMREENVTSNTFIKACSRALELVTRHAEHMNDEWQSEKLATIFETATSLSPRNTFLTKLYVLEGPTDAHKEEMKKKMQQILDRNLGDRLELVKTGETKQIDRAQSEGYTCINEIRDVMGEEWVKGRKDAFMLEFVKCTPTKEAAIHIQYYYANELYEDAKAAFQAKAREIAQTETKRLAFATAKKEQPDMSPSKTTTKDLPAFYTTEFREILGEEWVEREWTNFSKYYTDALSDVEQGVEPSYMNSQVEELKASVQASMIENRGSGDWTHIAQNPDQNLGREPQSGDLSGSVYSIDNYDTLYKQVASDKKEEIDFARLNSGLRELAKTPYETGKHAEWIAFCDKFGLEGHRAYFEMAKTFAARYGAVAKHRDAVAMINSQEASYAEIFGNDEDMMTIVSDHFRSAVIKNNIDLRAEIRKNRNWQVINWKNYTELLADRYMNVASKKLVEIAGGELDKVFEHVWRLDGEPQGNDNYGEDFAFTEGFSKFTNAFWEVAREKLQAQIDSL